MDIFGVRRAPYMARRNYVVEIQHLLLWGLFAGIVEGTVAAVIVSKTFGGSDLLIAIVQATPAFANLSSFLWGAMIVGRRKLPALTALATASLSVACSVGLTPESQWGGWIFASQVCLSRVFMSGVVTTRASLWKSNYPKSHRGRIAAALQLVRVIGSLPVILGAGLLFDWDSSAYKWFYPAVAVVGAISLLVFRRARVRGERAALGRRVNGGDGAMVADDDLAAPFSLAALISPWLVIGRMREALRQDPRFARYCKAQMCIGAANLMVMPVNAIILTKVLNLTYTASNGLLDIIPRTVTILMLPIWARLFDRVGVLRFRVVNSACWCGSLALCGLGALFAMMYSDGAVSALTAALATYYAGRIMDGLAQSGGAIAWNIGHLHFAEDDKAELYMGIHVSLTGFRGLLAPLAGTLLYMWIDWGVFVVGLCISAMGLVIFSRLAGEERRHSPLARS